MYVLLTPFHCEDLIVENQEIFIPHLYLVPPQGVTPWEFRKDV